MEFLKELKNIIISEENLPNIFFKNHIMKMLNINKSFIQKKYASILIKKPHLMN